MSSSVAGPHGPPVELTRLIGRGRERRLALEQLDRSRLVTLTGDGGMGKTRLAIRLGHELVRAYPGRVWFAELAEITGPDQVAERVAVAMGLQPGQTPDQLDELVFEHAEQAPGVLILDNCEHVIDGASKFADRLLRSGTQVRILATSRESLDLYGETLVRLAGLPLGGEPQPATGGSDAGAGAGAGSDAEQLFVERVAASGLSPASLDQAAIAQICEQLDGVPLAIELAAARMRILSAPQILERLNDPMRLLRAGGIRTADRHRTIEASIDWSYGLCNEAEQRTWARCTVFRGGFDLAAAEAVCSDSELAPDELIDAISGLVTKSVLTATGSGPTRRYHLVHTVRSFGAQRLAEPGEQETWRCRHRDWLTGALARAERDFISAKQGEWLQFLKDEELNLAAAFRSAVDAGDDADTLFALCVPLVSVRWLVGHGSLLARLRTALDRPGPITAARLTAQARLASMSMVLEGVADVAAIDQTLREAEELGATRARIWALGAAGFWAMGQRRFDEADRLLKLGLAENDYTPDELTASLLFSAISVHGRTGDWARLSRDHQLMRDLLGPTGETQFQERAIVVLAGAAYRTARFDEAAAFALEALSTAENAYGPVMVANTVGILAGVELERGDLDRARSLLLAAEVVWRDIQTSMSPYVGTRRQIHEAFRARLGSADYEALLATVGATTTSFDRARDLALRRDRSPEPIGLSADLAAWNGLTEREREVGRLIAEGLTNREISARLFVSPRTAEGHVARVMAKLALPNRAGVAAWVYRLPGKGAEPG